MRQCSELKNFSIFFLVGIPPAPMRPNCDNMENLPGLRSPRMQQQPKTLMVTSSSITGRIGNFHNAQKMGSESGIWFIASE